MLYLDRVKRLFLALLSLSVCCAHAQQAGFYPLDTSTWAALKPVFRDKQIVGLGESTHGTWEFYRERYNISRFLIENCGYRTVILEADFAALLPLDAYVRTGAGNPDTILKQAGSWMFYTKSMSDFVRWVRAFNTSRPASDQVYLLGMDIYNQPVNADSSDQWQPLRELNKTYAARRSSSPGSYRDSCMAENVRAICALTGTKAVVWAHNLHIARRDNQVDYPVMETRLGEHLHKALQDKYCGVGMFFDRGEFMVMHHEVREGKNIFPYLSTVKVKSSRSLAFTRDLARRYPEGLLLVGNAVGKNKETQGFYKPQRIYTAGSFIVPGTSEIMLTPVGAFSIFLFVPESTPLVQLDDAIRETRP